MQDTIMLAATLPASNAIFTLHYPMTTNQTVVAKILNLEYVRFSSIHFFFNSAHFQSGWVLENTLHWLRDFTVVFRYWVAHTIFPLRFPEIETFSFRFDILLPQSNLPYCLSAADAAFSTNIRSS